MRVAVRAKPGSRRESVSLDTGEDRAPVLVVRVRARAVGGAANSAIVAVVATALGLRRRQVEVVGGQRSRHKVLDIDADDTDVTTALGALPVEPT